MRRRAWKVSNWVINAKDTMIYDKSLYELHLEGVYPLATVFNILYGGIKTRKHNKPVKELLIEASKNHKYVHMTNEEILERDNEWDKRYPSLKSTNQEDEWKEYGTMGELKNFNKEEDDNEAEEEEESVE